MSQLPMDLFSRMVPALQGSRDVALGCKERWAERGERQGWKGRRKEPWGASEQAEGGRYLGEGSRRRRGGIEEEAGRDREPGPVSRCVWPLWGR